jgi:hypothetical protein
MHFEILEATGFKNKYFYRTQKWDWLTRDRIHVFDNRSPKMVTMDYWSQHIFLEANGQKTFSEFVYFIASKYPKNQVPKNLDTALIEEMTRLIVEEKLIALSDDPVVLDVSILNPLTEEGEIDLIGTWTGTYTYNIPEKYKDEKTKEVEFTINISKIIDGNRFEGTVEDDLKTGGTPGIGTIEGQFSEKDMCFEKKMPVHARIEIDGSHSINESKKHPVIIYEGEFSRSKNKIHGTWRFKKKLFFWKGIVPLWVSLGNGEFKMSKI